jgi:hypothetical protein
VRRRDDHADNPCSSSLCSLRRAVLVAWGASCVNGTAKFVTGLAGGPIGWSYPERQAVYVYDAQTGECKGVMHAPDTPG